MLTSANEEGQGQDQDNLGLLRKVKCPACQRDQYEWPSSSIEGNNCDEAEDVNTQCVNACPSIQVLDRVMEWIQSAQVVPFSSNDEGNECDICWICHAAQYTFSSHFREAIYKATEVYQPSRNEVSSSDSVKVCDVSSSGFPPLSATLSSLSPVHSLVPRTKQKVNAITIESSLESSSKTKNKQSNSMSPSKRRIRPATMISLQRSDESFSKGVAVGNIASLPSEDPISLNCLHSFTSPPISLPLHERTIEANLRNKGYSLGKKSLSRSSLSSKTKNVWGRSSHKIDDIQKGKVKTSGSGTDTFDERDRCPISFENLRPTLQKLAAVFSLILKHRLVPSLPSDIAGIVRLLSKHGSSYEQSNIRVLSLRQVFSYKNSCAYFAREVIEKGEAILLTMPYHILRSLVNQKDFKDSSPRFIQKADLLLTQYQMLLVDLADDNLIGKATKFNFTQNFKSERDSRHNWRSTELSRVYSNREASRDLFLRLFRKFQDSKSALGLSKGNSHEKMREDSISVIRQLDPANMHWFAELFCDLLLQIGLVPLQETDAEVLKRVNDVDKLQKLHRRFSSKEGKLQKKNHKTGGRKYPSLSRTPETSFPGHQQFFWIFLASCDSFQLNIHLTRQMLSVSSKLMKSKQTERFSMRLAKMRVLAKFLGLLAFSPFYEKKNSTVMEHKYEAIEHANLHQLALSINEYIYEALKSGNLVTVIPWIAEYLSMLRWDTFYNKHSSYLRRVIGTLYHVYLKLPLSSNMVSGYHRHNLQLVMMILGRLFDEIFDWQYTIKCISSQEFKSDIEYKVVDDSLDCQCLKMSRSFIFELIPSLEDLDKSLTEEKFASLGAGHMKKMRPNTLNLMDKDLGSPSNYAEYQFHPIVSKGSSFRDKLATTFFHQHQDLRTLADAVADCTVKNVSLTLKSKMKVHVEKKFKSLLENGQVELFRVDPVSTNFEMSHFCDAISSIQTYVFSTCRTELETKCKNDISGTLSILIQNKDELVKDVAIRLTIQHALKKSISLLESYANQNQVKTNLQQAIQNLKKNITKR